MHNGIPIHLGTRAHALAVEWIEHGPTGIINDLHKANKQEAVILTLNIYRELCRLNGRQAELFTRCIQYF